MVMPARVTRWLIAIAMMAATATVIAVALLPMWFVNALIAVLIR